MSLHVVRSKSHHPLFKGLAFGDMVTFMATVSLNDEIVARFGTIDQTSTWLVVTLWSW